MQSNYSQVTSNTADILVVDDTAENIRFLSAMLAQQGYQVRKALNGKMALMSAQTTPPNLILLDVNMPEMDGFEVCKQLKAHEKTATVPVIFLSALDEVTDKVKAFQVGAIDFITKPFQFEDVLVRIQTHLKIQELQSQLQAKNNQVQQALLDLKQMQAQLIRKEKMLSLEQLVAGVCHELNNPINFIVGNLNPAHEYIEKLLQLINSYRQEYPEPSPAMQTLLEETDLDFITADLQNIIRSMRVGAKRVSSIVLALRIFSRLGESDIKAIDFHEGLDSTVLLLGHRLASKADMPTIEIVRNYGEIPPVTCYVGELNQVFLNLLNNAIDALERKFHSSTAPKQVLEQTPTIWLCTELNQAQTVTLRIQDNGIGILESAKAHLFEPFFTTKPVGQGTGLGLATSYQIVVQKHNGHLSYVSTPNEGTEFSLTIPISFADRS
ncbi:MAG: response regulator [Stenomitos frigidus ULC029]